MASPAPSRDRRRTADEAAPPLRLGTRPCRRVVQGRRGVDDDHELGTTARACADATRAPGPRDPPTSDYTPARPDPYTMSSTRTPTNTKSPYTHGAFHVGRAAVRFGVGPFHRSRSPHRLAVPDLPSQGPLFPLRSGARVPPTPSPPSRRAGRKAHANHYAAHGRTSARPVALQGRSSLTLLGAGSAPPPTSPTRNEGQRSSASPRPSAVTRGATARPAPARSTAPACHLRLQAGWRRPGPSRQGECAAPARCIDTSRLAARPAARTPRSVTSSPGARAASPMSACTSATARPSAP